MQLGVYLETFLQAVMSVSHVVQLKFHVAVVQLGVHFGAYIMSVMSGKKERRIISLQYQKWKYTYRARDRCIFAVTEKWLELCCGG